MSDPTAYFITIDGPSGSGKGTLALTLARELGFHLLDSGAIYRLLALKALQAGIDLHDESKVCALLDNFDIHFETGAELAIPFLDGRDVSGQIRLEKTGEAASIVAQHGSVRTQLLETQRAFFEAPGLVADGRDMGTTVFPDARFKFFLMASVEIRAKRRYKQLIAMGKSANIAALQQEIADRDERDQNRSQSPLRPAEDALVVDSSLLDLGQVADLVLDHIRSDD